MNLKEQLDALLDATAFDSTGTKIGAVRQVYVDDASGKLTFATVSTGVFSADAIVPLHGARLIDNELHVDHTRVIIRDSPRPENTEDALTPEQEFKLLEYYGIEAPARGRGAAETASAPKSETKRETKDKSKSAPNTAPSGARAADGKSGKSGKSDAPKPDAAKTDPTKAEGPAKDSQAASTKPTDKPAGAKNTDAKSAPSPARVPSGGKKPSTSDAAPGVKSDLRETAPEKKSTTTTATTGSSSSVKPSSPSDSAKIERPGATETNDPASPKDGESSTSPKRD